MATDPSQNAKFLGRIACLLRRRLLGSPTRHRYFGSLYECVYEPVKPRLRAARSLREDRGCGWLATSCIPCRVGRGPAWAVTGQSGDLRDQPRDLPFRKRATRSHPGGGVICHANLPGGDLFGVSLQPARHLARRESVHHRHSRRGVSVVLIMWHSQWRIRTLCWPSTRRSALAFPSVRPPFRSMSAII